MFIITMPPTTSEMLVIGHHHGRNQRKQVVDEAADRVRSNEVETVFLAGLLMEPVPQRDAREIDGLLPCERPLDGWARAKIGDGLAGAEKPVEDAVIGMTRGVVLTSSERRTEPLLNADDGEIQILNLEGLAHGRSAVRERDCSSDRRRSLRQRRRFVLPSCVKSARPRSTRFRISGKSASAPMMRRILRSQVAPFCVGTECPVSAVEGVVAVSQFEIVFVGQFQFAVIFELVEKFLARACVDDLLQDEGFAAERFRRALLRVDAETVDGGTDQNHAGDADHDAEQRQKSSELVGDERVPGEANGARQLVSKSRVAG